MLSDQKIISQINFRPCHKNLPNSRTIIVKLGPLNILVQAEHFDRLELLMYKQKKAAERP